MWFSLFKNSKLSNDLYNFIWGVSSTKGFSGNLCKVEGGLFPLSRENIGSLILEVVFYSTKIHDMTKWFSTFIYYVSFGGDMLLCVLMLMQAHMHLCICLEARGEHWEAYSNTFQIEAESLTKPRAIVQSENSSDLPDSASYYMRLQLIDLYV